MLIRLWFQLWGENKKNIYDARTHDWRLCPKSVAWLRILFYFIFKVSGAQISPSLSSYILLNTQSLDMHIPYMFIEHTMYEVKWDEVKSNEVEVAFT